MSRIKLEEFTNNVELNRQLLIKHCNQNGVGADKDMSLSKIVELNNTIENEHSGKYYIMFLDVYGNQFAPTQYVDEHGKVDFTNITPPTHDEEYLEFLEYATDSYSFDDVVSNIVVAPRYRVKADAEGRRWTILKIFPNANVSYNIKYTKPSGSTLYVDWGDGTLETYNDSTTTATITHTYSETRAFAFRIWCDTEGYYFNEKSPTPFKDVCSAIYMGDNLSKAMYTHDNTSVQVLIFPTYSLTNYSIMHDMAGLFSVVFPENVALSIGQFGYSNTNLRYFILPKSSTLGTLDFTTSSGGGRRLIHLSTLENVSDSNYGTIGSNALKKVDLRSNRLTSLSIETARSLQELKYQTSVSTISGLKYAPIKTLVLPSHITSMGSAFLDYALTESLIIENVGINITLGILYYLTTLVIPKDFDGNIDIDDCPILSKETILNIARNIKDLNNATANTLKLHRNAKFMAMEIYVDSDGNEIEDKTLGTTLLAFMQNKNWTVS